MAEPDPLADEARLAAYASQLVDAVARALPAWVRRGVASRTALSGSLEPDVERASNDAVARLVPQLEALLTLDIDDQAETPLSVLRGAVPYPTSVLAAAGVPPARRDREAERLFPDDVYDLAPAAFADFGDEVHEAGVAWGAAKAFVHLSRHRPEGRSSGGTPG